MSGAPETQRGQALFEELLWVHSVIRRDLETVERLAADVDAGLPGEEVQSVLRDLKANGPLWQLKVNCLRYCHFVHSHHNAEDAMLFPALRRENPDLAPVVDRLEADHRRVSDHLDAVEAAARTLTETNGDDARERVAALLGELRANLLEHLDFEEREAGPTIRRF